MMATKQPRTTREQKYPLWLTNVQIARLEAKAKKKAKSEDLLTEAKGEAVKAKVKLTKAKESPSVINGNVRRSTQVLASSVNGVASCPANVSKSTNGKRKAVTLDERQLHVCPICINPIFDEVEDQHAQDAIFCDGKCQMWLHRWCASVTKERYNSLSGSDDPFLCPSCFTAAQETEISCLRECINTLKEELAALKAMVVCIQVEHDRNQKEAPNLTSTVIEAKLDQVQDELGSLKSELASAKSFIENQSKLSPKMSYAAVVANTSDKSLSGSSNIPFQSQCLSSYASTVSSKSKHWMKAKNKLKVPIKTKPYTNKQFGASVSTMRPDIPRSKVNGVRRVWGTLHHTTTKSVQNVISRLCNIEGLSIRRKTRISHSKTTWWFVIHGDESLLCELDSKWAVVNMQTCWALQICSKPVDMAPNPFRFVEPIPSVQSTFEVSTPPNAPIDQTSKPVDVAPSPFCSAERTPSALPTSGVFTHPNAPSDQILTSPSSIVSNPISSIKPIPSIPTVPGVFVLPNASSNQPLTSHSSSLPSQPATRTSSPFLVATREVSLPPDH